MTIERKIVELLDFIKQSQPYTVNKSPKLKIEYAVQKVLFRISKKLEVLNKELQEKQNLLREKYALVDKDGCYVYNVREVNGSPVEFYKFTKQNELKLKTELRDLEKEHLETVVEFEPFIQEKFPALSEWEVAAFRGIIIPENYELPEPSATFEKELVFVDKN